MYTHLHLVTSITNPAQFQSRIRLYHQFAKYLRGFENVTLWTIEGAFPGQPFTVTNASDPHHVQVDLIDPIWHKENLLNILIDRLPKDGQPVAWVDADIVFTRPDWVDETLRLLETHDIIQMFEECQDLTDTYGVVPGSHMRSTIAQWIAGIQEGDAYTKRRGHCGYAWAATRDALDRMGGLMEIAILGSGDYQMACAFMGDIAPSLPWDARGCVEYIRAIKAYGQQVKKAKLSVGYMEGMVLHHWHGKKANRGYEWRNRILGEHHFNPETDLLKQPSGLLSLNPEGGERIASLRQSLWAYFAQRDEDATAK